MGIVATLAIMLLLLAMKCFFSGSEIALVSSDKVKMLHQANKGNKGAALLLKLYKKPETLLATTLVGTNLATVGLTTLGTVTMIELFGARGELAAMLILVPVLLIFGEIVPKSIMQQKANTLTPLIIYPLHWVAVLVSPITFVVSRIAKLFARLMGASDGSDALSMDREQLKAMVDMTKRTENARDFDQDRLSRVLRFSETTISQVMIPVDELPSISVEETTETAMRLVRERGYRRLLVTEGCTSNVIGHLTITPWQMMDRGFVNQPLRSIVSEPILLKPDQTIDEVLPVLWSVSKSAVGSVREENGTVVGLVGIEDIVEEILGDIEMDEATIGKPTKNRAGQRLQTE